jgi:hypothetical protein
MKDFEGSNEIEDIKLINEDIDKASKSMTQESSVYTTEVIRHNDGDYGFDVRLVDDEDSQSFEIEGKIVFSVVAAILNAYNILHPAPK